MENTVYSEVAALVNQGFCELLWFPLLGCACTDTVWFTVHKNGKRQQVDGSDKLRCKESEKNKQL